MEAMEALPSYAQLGLQPSDEFGKMLFAQAEALWPQEKLVIQSYFENNTTGSLKIIDIGCGSGEITLRLAQLFPNSTVLGVDLEERHIKQCTDRASRTEFKDRVSFQTGNAYNLKELQSRTFDLVVCRSMLHAVQQPEKIITELLRITKVGGFVHMMNEDYGMLWFSPTSTDTKMFWNQICGMFQKTGSNPYMGRDCYGIVRSLSKESKVTTKFISSDTCNTSRDTLVAIMETWRDGYTELIAQNSDLNSDQVRTHWNDIIQCIKNPDGWGCWQCVICTVCVQ